MYLGVTGTDLLIFALFLLDNDHILQLCLFLLNMKENLGEYWHFNLYRNKFGICYLTLKNVFNWIELLLQCFV